MSDLIGEKLALSAKISELVKNLTSEVGRVESEISGVRPADPSRIEASKATFNEVGNYRGRALFYPFLGTGAGHGPYVELVDGSVKIDLINGIGVHIFGHGHAKIREAAIRGAMSDVVMQGNLEPNLEYAEIGKKLAKLAGRKSRLKHVWLSTCGTMANENALKMARQKRTPAKLVVAFQNAFAGRSTFMAEVTDNPSYKQGLPDYNEVLRLPFYNPKVAGSSEKTLSMLKEHVANNPGKIACFVFEPMLGEGGYQSAPREFFIPLLEFCRSQKIAVWVDEIQTFMRTGELFAFETLDFGDYVDICTVAKTLQTGATIYTEEYNPQPGLISGTFSGCSSALSAGIASLDIIVNEGYLGPNGKIMKIHREFIAMLNQLNEGSCRGLLRDANGLGLMIAVTPLDGSKDKVNALLQKLFNNGLIAFSCGRDPYRLRFLVPLVMTSKDIEVAKGIIEKSILEMA